MREEHQSIIDARVREIKNEIMRISERACEKGTEIDDERIINYYEEISDLVTNYARLHHEQPIEATTILELALWKAIILRSSNDKEGFTHAECWTDAGRCAEVVIKLVRTFL